MNPYKHLVIALDGMDVVGSAKLLLSTHGQIGGIKCHDLIDREGPQVISFLKRFCDSTPENPIMVVADIKAHDIGKTVRNRVLQYRYAGANFVTVHASGGVKMMKEAVEIGKDERADPNGNRLAPALIFAITVLTSLDQNECQKIYNRPEISDTVLVLAELAAEAGVHGLVCSAKEVGMMSKRYPQFQFLIPGTRSPGADQNDQARVDTPANAIFNGADYLVIGRQATTSQNPADELNRIAEEIKPALAEREAANQVQS